MQLMTREEVLVKIRNDLSQFINKYSEDMANLMVFGRETERNINQWCDIHYAANVSNIGEMNIETLQSWVNEIQWPVEMFHDEVRIIPNVQ